MRARFAAGDAIQLEVLEVVREAAEARAGLVDAVIRYNQAPPVLHYQVYGAAWEMTPVRRRARS